MVRELAEGPGVLLLAGRFEGIDERVIEARALREVSIGDYVLSGGELAAMVLIDAVACGCCPASSGQATPRSTRRASRQACSSTRTIPARRMGGPPHPRCPALGRPPAHRRVAPRRGARAPHRRAPARPPRGSGPKSASHGRLARRPREQPMAQDEEIIKGRVKDHEHPTLRAVEPPFGPRDTSR